MSVRSLTVAPALAELDGAPEFGSNPLRWVEEYVPTEVVVVFIAVMAFAASWSIPGRWIVVAILAVVVLLLVAIDPFGERGRDASTRLIVYQTVVAVGAYFAWTLLDPHNPTGLDPRIGVGIAVFVSLVLSLLARSSLLRRSLAPRQADGAAAVP